MYSDSDEYTDDDYSDTDVLDNSDTEIEIEDNQYLLIMLNNILSNIFKLNDVSLIINNYYIKMDNRRNISIYEKTNKKSLINYFNKFLIYNTFRAILNLHFINCCIFTTLNKKN